MSTPLSAVSFKKYGGRAPENYERYFVPAIGMPFARELVEVAGLRPGERVLDVACGTGAATRLAAKRVGSEGTVSGLDVNRDMLAVARTLVPDTSIEWHEASSESIPVRDASFDVVLCSLGLQFMPDKAAALREMYRVLAVGGRVAIGTVGPTPVFEILAQALARHLSPEVAGFVRQVFSLDDHRYLGELLAGAGFTDVRVHSKSLTLRLPGPAEFLWQYAHATPLARAVAHLSDEGQAALERDVVAGWQTFVKNGSLTAEPAAVLSVARK